MTDKQKRFCDEYLKDQNAAKAARAAGYSEKAARQQGQLLLTKTDIQNYIREQQEKMHDDTIADAKELRQTLTSIIRQQLMEDCLVTEGCGDGVSEVVHKEKRPALRDVNKSIELLAKLQGLFDDRAQINVCVPVFSGEDDLHE